MAAIFLRDTLGKTCFVNSPARVERGLPSRPGSSLQGGSVLREAWYRTLDKMATADAKGGEEEFKVGSCANCLKFISKLSRLYLRLLGQPTCVTRLRNATKQCEIEAFVYGNSKRPLGGLTC